ncbi:MAG: TonB-dependent receptor [Acidobacteria bacterium]|nr:TonB-dependent receptor [Acidobacteriota bacterium]
MLNLKRRLVFAISLSLWLVFGLCAADVALGQSQASTGQIVGTVLDPKGAAIAGAKVAVSSPTTGLKREVVTNSEGQFLAILLPSGRYDVTVEAEGFQRASASGVEVNVGRSVDANFNLNVGGVAEVVEIQAGVSIDTTRPETGTFVNTMAIRDLPINGRRFQDFAALTPTVQVEPQRNQLSFAGQRGINANISIDGADYNNPFFGGIRGGERSNNAFTIPQESIGEFQVVASGYSAEFGRSSGGVLNVITKSGTNAYHGSAFYLLRHKEFAAEDAFGFQTLATQQQSGGSIGGPIIKDKMFFFGAVEVQRFSTPRQVFYPRLLGITSAPDTAEAFDLYRSLEGPFNQTNNAVSYMARTDAQLGANHRLAARYNYSTNTGANANATGDSINPQTSRALSNNGTEEDRTHTVVGQLTSVFTPSVVNELRLQYSHERRPRVANTLAPNVNTVLGSFGTRNFLPTTQVDWRFQLAEAITWNVGRHSVKFGTEWNHTFADQIFGFNQTGSFNFSGSDVNTHLRILSLTPGVVGDNRFDTTAVTYDRNIGNLSVKGDMNEMAFFAQDSFRIRNNLTFYYGLRYEAQFNPQPDVSNTAVYNLVRNFSFPLGRIDPAVIPDNTNQVMPRVGFAWDPWSNGKTVIRGNVGYYYARTPFLLMTSPLNNFRLPPGDLSIRLPLAVPAGNTNNTVYRQLLAIGINLNNFTLANLPILTVDQVQSIAAALGLTAPDPFRGANLITWAPNFENPRSLQWSLALEHEVRNGLVLGIDFSYVNTVHLQRSHDFNLPLPRLRATDQSQVPFFGLRSGTPRPIPTLGTVLVRESSARSLYRGVTFRSNWRKSRFQFNAFYTLSWNYSTDDNERSATGQEELVNAYDFSTEYGFSRLDARHIFTMNSVVSLPLGFEVSGIIRARSGLPLNPYTGTDTNEDLFNNDRPLQAPGVYFARNSFRNRAVTNVDMRVMKGFNLWSEESKLQLSFEFFNLLNAGNIQFAAANIISGAVNNIYGAGISPTNGSAVPIDARFRRLRNADGTIDRGNTQGLPFQGQVGLRLIF